MTKIIMKNYTGEVYCFETDVSFRKSEFEYGKYKFKMLCVHPAETKSGDHIPGKQWIYAVKEMTKEDAIRYFIGVRGRGK